MKNLIVQRFICRRFITLLLILSVFLTGCGVDEDDVENLHKEDDVENLYKELVGTYDLFKAEVTYVNQPKLVLAPPNITGTMTISSDQKMVQKIQVSGVSVFVSGTLEIRVDEKLLLIDNDQTDFVSQGPYTWDGEILTTTVDVGTYIEKDFWRKSTPHVIELLDAPENLAAGVNFISASPPSGSEIAHDAAIVATFNNAPANVEVNAGRGVLISGKTVTITGPFIPGPLSLTITWTDGAQTLTYTVIAPDREAPFVTGGTIKDGDRGVDPEKINAEGMIEVTFSEDVVGHIALGTEGHDDIGWLGKVEGNRGRLELVRGKEIGNETFYIIRGRVRDAAGNEAEIFIKFLTAIKR